MSIALSVINETLEDTGCTYIQVTHRAKEGDYIFDLPTNQGRITLYPKIPSEHPSTIRTITLSTLLALHKLAIREIEDFATSIARSVTV